MSLILYPTTEKAFDTNGIGILSDADDAEVYEELNGQYELTVKYPVNGMFFSDIVADAYITAKPDPVTDPQPFRIYRISKPMKGQVTVYARHNAYRNKKIVVSPFVAASAQAALQGLKANAVNDCPFEFWTDKTTSAEMSVSVPKDIWTILGNSKGSMLDTYGGEYEFDKFSVKLWNRRGADRGVSIRYGKNLTDLKMEENIANVYTGVYPYWTARDGTLVTLPEKKINGPGTYDEEKILPLDMSQMIKAQPTEAQLREHAQKYIEDNDIGKPDVSWTVTFVQLEETEEYKGKALLERVLLGDTVSVIFPKLNVDVSARAVAARYKPLLGRYKNITLGKIKANIADTIVSQNKEIEKKPSVSLVEQITAALTVAITGAKGGAVRMLDTNGDGMPDTLYIADNPDPALAVKVWRFNYEGWAASKNGYNGPFVMGATLDEGILAEAITAARLVAGTIQSADGGKTLFIDLDNGIFRAKGGTLSYTAMAYLDPGEEEFETIKKYLLSQINLTDDQLALYDIDGDGEVTITDMMQVKMIMVGQMEFKDRPGAQMSEVTVIIDPSDPEKAIKITGTNQWGRDVEIYYGVNGTNARAAKSDFSISGKLNVGGATTLNGPLIGYTGILYDTLPSVDELEENQIILGKVPTATTEETTDG